MGSYPSSGYGLLLTHSCVITQQGDEARATGIEYDHPYRLVAPVIDLQSEADPGSSAWDAITRDDKIVRLMYLPAVGPLGPSVALLHRANLVLHDNLGNRVAQMKKPGATWLQAKLVRLFAGTWLPLGTYDPPMD